MKDGDGNSVDSIQVNGVTFDVEHDVDVYMIVPTLAYVVSEELKKKKEWLRCVLERLGNAKYGCVVSQPFGNTSYQGALETDTNPAFQLEIDESKYGHGDTYVKPIWLGWDLCKDGNDKFDGYFEIAAGYGFYAPTGIYDKGEDANMGLGMWTHEFQAAGAYYLDDDQKYALTIAGTYEIHHNKEDIDIRLGSHFSLNYGLDVIKTLYTNKESSLPTLYYGLGVSGYGQWQVTEDSGSDAVNNNVKDEVYGIGLQAQLIYAHAPCTVDISFQWMHEFEAEDRFEGDFLTLTIGMNW